eukprot:12366557-Ditylum_brightwellii.AAC.1
MAKNSAPAMRVAQALLIGVRAWARMLRYTDGGRAFWCLVEGSAFMYPLTWCPRTTLFKDCTHVIDGLACGGPFNACRVASGEITLVHRLHKGLKQAHLMFFLECSQAFVFEAQARSKCFPAGPVASVLLLGGPFDSLGLRTSCASKQIHERDMGGVGAEEEKCEAVGGD